MDSVKRSAVTPSKSRLARAISKALHFRAVAGVAPDDDGGVRKAKPRGFKHVEAPTYEDENGAEFELDERMVNEAFLSKLFASVSAVKAAYAEMQFAESPHDADGIQAADKAVIAELKRLSELKQSYLRKQLHEASPATTLLLSEIEEQKSTLKIYDVTTKKLDAMLKVKESETIALKGKLSEANKANKSLEKRLSSSGQFIVPDNVKLSNLRLGDFLSCHRHMLKSIRSFVQLLIAEMGSAGWDLEAAAESIEPGVRFRKPSHKCFAFESFVCRQMFDGFSSPGFSAQKPMPERDKRRSLFFTRFVELKSAKPADYLARNPNAPFATFCRAKYLKLVHPKMEASLFGGSGQGDAVVSGEVPGTPFFSAFLEMAKRVWLLHCIALSFEAEVSVFEVKKGIRFSEVYMESVSDDALLLLPEPVVALAVVPGFGIGKSVVQGLVYLC